MFYAVCVHIFQEFHVMSTPIWGASPWQLNSFLSHTINQPTLFSPGLTSPVLYHYWLVVEPYPSEKYESVGMMIIHNIWKNKKMFQTTNQTVYIYIFCVSHNAANQGANKTLIYLHQLFAIETSAGILSNPPPKKELLFPCSSGLPHFLPTISWSTWKIRFARWDCSDLNL